MPFALDPLKLLALALGSWINQHQQDVIEYLKEENRVLRIEFARLGSDGFRARRRKHDYERCRVSARPYRVGDGVRQLLCLRPNRSIRIFNKSLAKLRTRSDSRLSIIPSTTS